MPKHRLLVIRRDSKKGFSVLGRDGKNRNYSVKRRDGKTRDYSEIGNDGKTLTNLL